MSLKIIFRPALSAVKARNDCGQGRRFPILNRTECGQATNTELLGLILNRTECDPLRICHRQGVFIGGGL